MPPIRSTLSIQDYRLATLFRLELKEVEEKIHRVFSKKVRQDLLRQSALYPWMQRTLNTRSHQEIKELSKRILLYEKDPELQPQLFYYLPGDSDDQWVRGEIGSLVKPSFQAINAQASLFYRAPLAKQWAEEQERITLASHGVHDVFPLRGGSNSNKVMTYFKAGKYERYIEVLVWDLAVIWGWEDIFAATKLDRVYVYKIFDEDGSEDIIDEIVLGSMQTAVQGYLFSKSKIREAIQPESIHKIFIAMYLLGLNDVHASNLIVQYDVTLRLFDNTKCLPPGNEWIFAPFELLPVHRFAPIKLEQCRVKLKAEERQKMRDIVAECNRRLPVMKKYFNSILFNKMVKHLPSNWLDGEKCFQALSSRVERLQSALDKTEDMTLYELFEEVYPEYRFAFLSTLIYCRKRYSKYSLLRPIALLNKMHVYVGGIGYLKIFTRLIEYGYSLPKIQKLAENRSLSLLEIAEKAVDSSEELQLQHSTEQEKFNAVMEMLDWLNQFREMPRDHKDDEAPSESFTSRTTLLKNVWMVCIAQCGLPELQEGSGKDLYDIQSKLYGQPFVFRCRDEKTIYTVSTDGQIEDTQRYI